MPHNLGSRNWTSAERELTTGLGEVDGGSRPYYHGAPPAAPLPLPLVLGDRPCFEDGEGWPQPAVARVLIGGIDSRCWTAQGLILPGSVRQRQAVVVAPPGYQATVGQVQTVVPIYELPALVGQVQSVVAAAGPPPLPVLVGQVQTVEGAALAAELVGQVQTVAIGVAGQVDQVQTVEGAALAAELVGQVQTVAIGVAGQVDQVQTVEGGGRASVDQAQTVTALSTITACSQCPGGAPRNWTLVAAGFTGICSALNGTYVLQWVTGCNWQTGPPAAGLWSLAFQSAFGAHWELSGSPPGSGFTAYRINAASWQCLAPNILALDSPNNCPSPPATLTLLPGP